MGAGARPGAHHLPRRLSVPLVEPGRKAAAFALPDTREACALRDARPGFTKGRAAVLGVSVLDSASEARFARKHALNVPLPADPEHAVARRWDNVKVDGHAADVLRAVHEL
jgi:peroxiredoxin